MLGAIAGDIIGSPYEHVPLKATDFPLFSSGSRFTDDTVLTVAVADVLLDGGDYVERFQAYFDLYMHAGYGGTFGRWAMARSKQPYNSFGNGSAMRVSPVGYAFDTLEEVLDEAARSAAVTHNHPEGIKGAQATAAAAYMARTGATKDRIRAYTSQTFGYDVETSLDSIRPHYAFDVTCQGTVPVAIRAFLESEDWEHAVRLAVSMGGDSDTLACITGGIAEAFYGGVPDEIADEALRRLDAPLKDVYVAFVDTFGVGR